MTTPDRSYYRKTSPTTTVDVYRVLQLFEVADPCLQHSIKKLLAAGKRGAKDAAKDVAEAIESLRRWQEMRIEEAQSELASAQSDLAAVLATPAPDSVTAAFYAQVQESAKNGDPLAIQLLQAAADLELKASRLDIEGAHR